MKITAVELIHVKPRSFLKMSTDEGITGWERPLWKGVPGRWPWRSKSWSRI